MSLAVPNQLNYQEGVLPVAIESRSSKRIFEPVNGTTFAPDSNNVIRFNINSDNLWDMSHSYLQVKLTNLTTNNTASRARVALDTGIPWCNRMQLMSGGQELENLDSYNRMHAMLSSVQGNPDQSADWGVTQRENFPLSAGTAAADMTVQQRDALTVGNTSDADRSAQVKAAVLEGVNIGIANSNLQRVDLENQASFRHCDTGNTNVALRGTGADTGYTDNCTYNFSPISAILNSPKYFPLIFSNLGLDVLFYLEDAINIGAWSHVDTATGDTRARYQVSNCQWHCHLVDVDRTFYDKLRSSMMASGGVLTFSGTTYKHYLENKVSSTSHSLTIPTRVKSLNSLIIRPQRDGLNNKWDTFCLSVGEGCRMSEYIFRIGSMQYPQQSVKVTNTNKGELYSEIRKMVGVLGNYAHASWINDVTLKTGPIACTDGDISAANDTDVANNFYKHGTTNRSGTVKSFFVAPYDFSGFAKTAAETGINVSDRALPVICEVTRGVIQNTANNADHTSHSIRYDIWAQCDFILYLSADGTMSTRI